MFKRFFLSLPLYSLLLYYIIYPFILLLWINNIFFNQVLIVDKTCNVLITFLSAYALLFLIKEQTKVSNIFIFLVVVIVWDILSIYVGYVNGFREKIFNDFFSLINGLIIANYFYYYTASIFKAKKIIKSFIVIIFSTFSAVIALLMIETFLNISFYPGLVSSPLALVVFYYFSTSKRKYLSILPILEIFLSGKRSVLIGIILSLLVFKFLFTKNKLKTIKYILLFTFMTNLFLVTLSKMEAFSPKPIEVAVSKFNMINPYSSEFNFFVASGERIEEIFESMNVFKKCEYSVFIGCGNGFVYPLYVFRKDYYEEKRHNVHFTPINFLTKYGLIFTVFFYLVLIHYVLKLKQLIKIDNNPYIRSLYLYFIYGIIMSLFSFNFVGNFLIWISLGILLKYKSIIQG